VLDGFHCTAGPAGGQGPRRAGGTPVAQAVPRERGHCAKRPKINPRVSSPVRFSRYDAACR